MLPAAWLDTVALRAIVTTAAVAMCLALFPAFAARVLSVPRGLLEERRLWLGLAAVLVAHYGVPRPYCFWYVYDIPAIVFYMLAFLAMTQGPGRVAWWCVPMLAVLSLNRETIVVAVLHAAAWHAWRARQTQSNGPSAVVVESRAPSLLPWALPLVCCLLGIVLVRAAVVHWLGQDAASVVLAKEGEQWRIVAGFARMADRPDHALALLLIGAGALVWLPRVRHQML